MRLVTGMAVLQYGNLRIGSLQRWVYVFEICIIGRGRQQKLSPSCLWIMVLSESSLCFCSLTIHQQRRTKLSATVRRSDHLIIDWHSHGWHCHFNPILNDTVLLDEVNRHSQQHRQSQALTNYTFHDNISAIYSGDIFREELISTWLSTQKHNEKSLK